MKISIIENMRNMNNESRLSFLDKIIKYCLENKLIVAMVFVALVTWGILVAPFDWNILGIERSPVPVDAISRIGMYVMRFNQLMVLQK